MLGEMKVTLIQIIVHETTLKILGRNWVICIPEEEQGMFITQHFLGRLEYLEKSCRPKETCCRMFFICNHRLQLIKQQQQKNKTKQNKKQKTKQKQTLIQTIKITFSQYFSYFNGSQG